MTSTNENQAGTRVWHRVRLIAAVILFAGWIVWLLYQASTSEESIAVSRPQVFSADVVMVVELKQLTSEPQQVRILHVYKGSNKLNELIGKDTSKPLQLQLHHLGKGVGWRGAGEYVIAVNPDLSSIKGKNKTPAMTLVPIHPKGSDPVYRIYPHIESVKKQLEELFGE